MRTSNPIRQISAHSLFLAAFLSVTNAVDALAFQTAPYEKLTNNRVEVANFNPEPFTGMVFGDDGALWAVNPYRSVVLRFAPGSITPSMTVTTGLHPVSIGLWLDPTPTPVLKLLVVCTGTHGLFVHSAATGEILQFMRLDSEPADLVVDQDNDRAFVSCQGTNTVFQINLEGFAVEHKHKLTCGTRAGALMLDRAPNPDDNRVYVAAAVTGNNSIPVPPNPNTSMRAAGIVFDLEGTDLDDNFEELPDEDIFRIDPVAETITPLVRRAGSLIFDLARNPDGDALWVLSTDSLNKDPTLLAEPSIDTEQELRGAFAINQLVAVPGVTKDSTLAQVLPSTYSVTDLDDIDPTSGVLYDEDTSLNQARTVEFFGGAGANRGDAFVASAQSDVVVRFDKLGARLDELQLLPRSQCYDLAKVPGQTTLVALCLGTMTIEEFDTATGLRLPAQQRSLGLDPTPDQIRRGRNVFLDGQISMDGRFSCASCHPRGMSDQLAWPLRNDPTDEKDIMLTQSLFSIADSFPHHWRGERDLPDFEKAFGGLLGAPAGRPTSAEMADLIVFFQSLQAPANPVQNPRRVLDDARGTTTITAMPGLNPGAVGLSSSAVEGQDAFQIDDSFNEKSCLECHSFENGSDSSHMTEGFFLRAPRSMPIEMAHLRQLQLRGKESVDVRLVSVLRTVNENGFGLLHDGREPTLLHFLVNNFGDIDLQERADAFRFTEQFDQGISPAVHWGQRYVGGGGGHVFNTQLLQIESDIKTVLIDGATNGWNDVVAVGLSDPDDGGASGFVPMRWWWDTSIAKFVPDSPAVASITWAQMKAKTRAGFTKNVFMGAPPSNGRRFGIDHDRDGLINGQEVPIPNGGTGTDPWNPNTDGGSGVDPWPDGYEVAHGDDPLTAQATSSDGTPPTLNSSTFDFATSRFAKYHVKFDEDVTYTVRYSTPGGPQRVFNRDYFAREDTFVITHDEPSTAARPDGPAGGETVNTFTATIEFRDRKTAALGGPAVGPIPLSNFEADDVHFPDFGGTSFNLHLTKVSLNQPQQLDADSLRVTIDIKIDYNYDGPEYVGGKVASDRMVFGSLAWKGTGNDFIKVNTTSGATNVTFASSGPTSFILDRPTLPDVPYTVAPGGDWICAPHTNAQESTTLTFDVHGLTPGDKLKFSVMGVLTPTTPNTPGTYLELSLQEMQPLLREDSQEVSFDFP